jgi:putative transposase
MLEILSLSKSSWYYAKNKKPYTDKYSHLRRPLMEIAKKHPEYGYRRTASELAERGFLINHKVVEKLHRNWNLSVMKRVKKPKPNPIVKLLKEAGSKVNLVSRLREIDDLEVFYTDFTEIVYGKGQAKAQLMPIIDHSSKLAAGHALGKSANTDLAVKAWKKMKATLKKLGRKTEDIIIHHDQDGVYTGYRWLHEVMLNSKARLSYSEDGAKENVYMESFNGRFKVENRLIFLELDDFEELEKVVNNRIHYYNFVRKHSALGNKSPMKYLKEKGKLDL